MSTTTVLGNKLKSVGVSGVDKPKRTPNHPTKSHVVVTKVDGKWSGKFIDPSGNEDLNYKVFINHYWDEFKPWIINCPIYNSFDYEE